MVRERRQQLALLGLLAALGGAIWYVRSGGPTVTGKGAATSKADAVALEDVAPVGLDRLVQSGASDEAAAAADRREQAREDEDAEVAASRAAAAAGAAPVVVAAATPAEPAPPPMNVRFIGAVEVRTGVWVASLLTDRKDLLTGKEGDVIGNRYRIVKIGVQSVDLLEVASGRQRRVQLGGS